MFLLSQYHTSYMLSPLFSAFAPSHLNLIGCCATPQFYPISLQSVFVFLAAQAPLLPSAVSYCIVVKRDRYVPILAFGEFYIWQVSYLANCLKLWCNSSIDKMEYRIAQGSMDNGIHSVTKCFGCYWHWTHQLRKRDGQYIGPIRRGMQLLRILLVRTMRTPLHGTCTCVSMHSEIHNVAMQLFIHD